MLSPKSIFQKVHWSIDANSLEIVGGASLGVWKAHDVFHDSKSNKDFFIRTMNTDDKWDMSAQIYNPDNFEGKGTEFSRKRIMPCEECEDSFQLLGCPSSMPREYAECDVIECNVATNCTVDNLCGLMTNVSK